MRLVFDFDHTIVPSSEALYKRYIIETGRKEKYNPNHGWDFKDLFPDDYKKRALELFCTPDFFEVLEPFPNAIEVLSELSKKHKIFVLTNHKAIGIPYKDEWIKKYLPFARPVYVDTFDKSVACGDVFVDDKPECLDSVKGNFKHIWCYGEYEWNKSWNKDRVLDWLDIKNRIDKIESEHI